MEMIGHQDEADDLPPGPGRLSGEPFQELLSIVVIVHDVLSDIAPRHDVIDGARELDTQSSWHRTKPPGTDLENRAILDREGRATRGDRARFEEIGACGHAARHAIKRVE
jgi:hypothetical protein